MPNFPDEVPWYSIAVATALFVFLIYIRLRSQKFKANNLELEKRMAERTKEMENILQELDNSRQTLIKRNLIQQRLLTSISHDIKSPLKFFEMVARQFLENLKRGNCDRESAQKVAVLMQEGSYHMLLLTENLLSYLKLYPGEGEVSSEIVLLSELAEEKRLLFNAIAESNGNQVLNKIPEDLFVESDSMLFSVILHNLLDNALKVTRNGKVIIEGSDLEDGIYIRVGDTGPGMPEQLVTWCNEMNQPVAPMPITGGLGLVIVKELMQLIGGRMRATSKKGEGTVIELQLPPNNHRI